ncbi:MAG: hypothetical protein IKH27_13700 [Oscillospiraceae bacterium]|nr:hypothetical protein [Oscillospiraceae bacterium]
MELNITVRNRLAECAPAVIVCGNTGDTVCFDTDAEWDAFPEKTAHFAYCRNGTECHTDVPFTGSRCAVPAVHGTDLLAVGLYAGDIRTTAPARIPCIPGITELQGRTYRPDPEIYHEAVEILARIRGGFADRVCLAADADGDFIATADGLCIACKEY